MLEIKLTCPVYTGLREWHKIPEKHCAQGMPSLCSLPAHRHQHAGVWGPKLQPFQVCSHTLAKTEVQGQQFTDCQVSPFKGVKLPTPGALGAMPVFFRGVVSDWLQRELSMPGIQGALALSQKSHWTPERCDRPPSRHLPNWSVPSASWALGRKESYYSVPPGKWKVRNSKVSNFLGTNLPRKINHSHKNTSYILTYIL